MRNIQVLIQKEFSLWQGHLQYFKLGQCWLKMPSDKVSSSDLYHY